MPIIYLGNQAPTAATPVRVYVRNTNLLLASTAPYRAAEGDVITSIYITRGDNINASGSFKGVIYVSDVDDIATATLLKVVAFPLVTAPAWSMQKTTIEPVPLVSGKYYWFAFRNFPGAYVAKPGTMTHQSALATILSTDPDHPSLAGLTFTNVSGGCLVGFEAMNLFGRDTVILGSAQTSPNNHIARDAAQYRAENVRVRFGEFTNRGIRVEVRTNGSFMIHGEGNHTFPVQFSTDSGNTWSPEQAVTVRDATVAAPVTTPNRPPVVAGAAVLPVMQINADNTLTASSLLQGATDADGNAMVIEDLVLTAGVATITGTGPWVVRPTTSAQLTFGYTVSDGNGGTVQQTATALVNRPPVSSGVLSLANTDVGVGLVVSTNDLLANVSDPDGDALTITNVVVTMGTGTVTGTGPYTITGTAAGTLQLAVTVSDGRGGTVVQQVSMQAVTPMVVAQNLAVFNGTSAYSTIENWAPTGKYGVYAVFDTIPTVQDAYLLVDSNNRYISVLGNQGKAQFGALFPAATLPQLPVTKYFSAIVENGKVTFSDGVNDVSVTDPEITLGSTYSVIGKRGSVFSNMSLSTLILFDFQTESNSRVYRADASGQLLSIVAGKANPANINLTAAGTPNAMYEPAELTNINTAAAWSTWYDSTFTGGLVPSRITSPTRVSDFGTLFSGAGQAWLQTFVAMHRLTGSDIYLTRAKDLVDYMFNYTDDKRLSRSEIHLTTTPEDDRYVEAPKQYLYTGDGGTRVTGLAAKGWRRHNGTGWVVDVQTSGLIASGIARLADYMLSQTNLSSYHVWAAQVLTDLRPILNEHDTSWSDTKNTVSVGGFWYYLNVIDGAQNANSFGDTGKLSNPLPFNHGLPMGVAMAIINRWQTVPTYNTKAAAVVDFFRRHWWAGTNSDRLWWAGWDVTANNRKTVDVATAANVDVPSVYWLHKLGYNFSQAEVVAMARGILGAEYAGTGVLHNRIDRVAKDVGDDFAKDDAAQAVGQFLLSVQQLDSSLYRLAKRAMRRYLTRPVSNSTAWGVYAVAAFDLLVQGAKTDLFGAYDVSPTVTNAAPTGTASINLGQSNVGDIIEITPAVLLAGITDADGDPLTVVDLEIISGTGVLESVASNPPTVTGPVSLAGPIEGQSIVVEVETLLEGAVDPDGDVLSVRNVSVVSGPITISGTGPYTVTATGVGAATLSYEITDGTGNTLAQTATMTTRAAPVLSGTVPVVSGFTGTVATGQTIRVSGSNLALSPTILAIKGNEAAAGTKVADHAPFGLLEHGPVPDTWRFAGDGTIVLTGQVSDVVEVYKVFPTKKHSVFAHYHLRYENVMPRANFPVGAQTKELRFSPNQSNLHSTGLVIGTGWNAIADQLWIYTGGGSNTTISGMTKEMAEQWHTRSTGAKVTNGVAVLSNIVSGPLTGQRYNENVSVAADYDGFGNVLMPFFIRDGLTLDMRIRNLIVLDGYARVELGNRPNRAECTIQDTQYAAMAGSDIDVNLDLSMFSSNDDIYLFAINEDNVYSNAIKIRDKQVVAYNRIADTLGLSRAMNNGASYLTMDTAYAASVLEKAWVDYRIGFKVNGWNSTTSTETDLGFSASLASASRGNLAVNRTTGAVTLKSQVNNVSVTVATVNPATFLGNRYDWVLRIPKNTGEMIQLYNETVADGLVLLGEVARPATFDNFAPERWMAGYSSARMNGVLYYLGCFGHDGLPIFDLRLNEGSGLVAYSEGGVVAQATISQSGASMTWVTA